MLFYSKNIKIYPENAHVLLWQPKFHLYLYTVTFHSPNAHRIYLSKTFYRIKKSLSNQEIYKFKIMDSISKARNDLTWKR